MIDYLITVPACLAGGAVAIRRMRADRARLDHERRIRELRRLTVKLSINAEPFLRAVRAASSASVTMEEFGRSLRLLNEALRTRRDA